MLRIFLNEEDKDLWKCWWNKAKICNVEICPVSQQKQADGIVFLHRHLQRFENESGFRISFQVHGVDSRITEIA